MSKSRLLQQVRARLNINQGDLTRQQAVDDRINQHAVNTVPIQARQSHPILVDLFEEHITQSRATVARIDSIDVVVDEIQGYLGTSEFCINAEVEELNLPFSECDELTLLPWKPKTSMTACVTLCLGAVAETGSLVIASSALNGVSQNFLGEKHIVLLQAENIVGAYEEMWQKVREAGTMPRDITLISGPSCTADIEMIIEYGAHGPRQLHVIIIGQSPTDYKPLPQVR